MRFSFAFLRANERNGDLSSITGRFMSNRMLAQYTLGMIEHVQHVFAVVREADTDFDAMRSKIGPRSIQRDLVAGDY